MGYQIERGRFLESMRLRYGMAEADALALLRYTSTLGRFNVIRCNVPLTERQEKQLDKRDASLERLAMKVAARYGMQIETGGDPRGYALKVIADGREIGVPEREVRVYP